jgi:hypothetical protein
MCWVISCAGEIWGCADDDGAPPTEPLTLQECEETAKLWRSWEIPAEVAWSGGDPGDERWLQGEQIERLRARIAELEEDRTP